MSGRCDGTRSSLTRFVDKKYLNIFNFLELQWARGRRLFEAASKLDKRTFVILHF